MGNVFRTAVRGPTYQGVGSSVAERSSTSPLMSGRISRHKVMRPTPSWIKSPAHMAPRHFVPLDSKPTIFDIGGKEPGIHDYLFACKEDYALEDTTSRKCKHA